MARLGREQAETAQQVRQAARELRDVMDALERNRMVAEAERRRYEAEIGAPLEDLGEDRIPRTAQEMAEAARRGSNAANQARTKKELDQIQDALKGVLDRLADTEDFADVLQRLEGVLDLHRKAIGSTKERAGAPESPPAEKAPLVPKTKKEVREL